MYAASRWCSDRPRLLCPRGIPCVLGRTEPGFTVFDSDGVKDEGVLRSTDKFGFFDEQTSAVALCTEGEIVGYGGAALARRLARAYARWAEFGLPGLADFALECGALEPFQQAQTDSG